MQGVEHSWVNPGNKNDGFTTRAGLNFYFFILNLFREQQGKNIGGSKEKSTGPGGIAFIAGY